MDQEDKQKLTDLRDSVVQELTPVLANSDMPPEDKFTLQLSAAQSSGQVDRYKDAFESIKQFSDDTSKANAYMDLLEAIDIQLGDISNSPEPDTQNTDQNQE